jgi:ABC-type multidrug transport system fused ATPase/permease subunit
MSSATRNGLTEIKCNVTFQNCFEPSIIANRWLSIRLQMLGNLIVLFAALFAVLGRNSLEPGLVGLSLSYATQITQTLNMLIRQTSMIENNMVRSAEQCCQRSGGRNFCPVRRKKS